VSLIPLDLPRTFPALAFFQPGGPWHDHLRQVLEAYACYRPDIGYVQGMSYIAAVLLINVVRCRDASARARTSVSASQFSFR